MLDWARDKGYGAMYGNPSHINRMMSDIDYSACTDGVAVFAHLITSSETAGGRDRSTVGVFFSKLCDFDFNPEALLDVQRQLQDIGKVMLADMLAGNEYDYTDPVRWQYGYDDYADNVAWVCLRLTAEALAVDCVPIPIPEPVVPPVNAYDEVTQGWKQVVGYTPLANGFGAFCKAVMWIGVSDTPLYWFNYSINGGDMETGQVASQQLVDDIMVEVMPFMEPYLGKYLIQTVGIQVEGEATVKFEFDGVTFTITNDFSQYC